MKLTAKLINRNESIVEFNWSTKQSFAEVVTTFGVTPLPPYIKRDASQDDVKRYQTVYSHFEGAVAAPTAGLHFTDQVLEALTKKGIEKDFLTLHVSAGTFQPVKVSTVSEHTMHSEQIVFTKAFVENLLEKSEFVIPVGTTSMRSLESLYWFGVMLEKNPESSFFIEKLYPYHNDELKLDSKTALGNIIKYLNNNNLEELIGETEIFIFPSYDFKICKAIITNFHQPSSTLILLIAALIGDDWRDIYDFALHHNYRFLSYGDSSLLFKK